MTDSESKFKEARRYIYQAQLILAMQTTPRKSEKIDTWCMILQDLMNEMDDATAPYTAEDIKVIPDDPSPCTFCGRPKSTSKTPINAQGFCWRKPGMQKNNFSVLDCISKTLQISWDCTKGNHSTCLSNPNEPECRCRCHK